MCALLDVNVLIALLDAGHVHHVAASEWLHGHVEAGVGIVPADTERMPADPFD